MTTRRKLLLVGLAAIVAAGPVVVIAQSVANVKSVFSGGDLYFQDKSANNILKIDGTNRAIDVPSGSSFKIAGTALGSSAAQLDQVANLSAQGAVTYIKRIAFTTTANTNAVSTGYTFPANAVLRDAWIKVTTADSGKTISVGNGAGSANEYLATITIGTTGVKIPSLVAGSVTLGSSLIETVTNSGSATHSARVPASVGGIAVSYKTSAAATTAGYIYLVITEIS